MQSLKDSAPPDKHSIIFEDATRSIYLGDSTGEIEKTDVFAKTLNVLDGGAVLKYTDLYTIAGWLMMGLNPSTKTNWESGSIFGNCLSAVKKGQDAGLDFNYLLNICGKAFFKTNRHMEGKGKPFPINLCAWTDSYTTLPDPTKIKSFGEKPSELGRVLENMFGTLGIGSAILWDPALFVRNSIHNNSTEFSFTSTVGQCGKEVALNELWHFRQRAPATQGTGTIPNARIRMTKVNFCEFLVSLCAKTLDDKLFQAMKGYDSKKLTLWKVPEKTETSITTVLSSRYITLNRFPICDSTQVSNPKATFAELDEAARTQAAGTMITYLRAWNLWAINIKMKDENVGPSTGVPQPQWNLEPSRNT